MPGDEFIFLAVTSINPSSGQPPLTVTIFGSGFAAGPGTTMVRFGANAGTNVSVASGTQLTVLLPNGTGVVDVSVFVAGVTTPAVVSAGFSYLTVTGTNFPPGEGVHFGGSVTLHGSGFVAGQTTVTLSPTGGIAGGLAWTVASQNVKVDSTKSVLTFVAPFQPTSAVGPYTVTVRTPYGVSVAPEGAGVIELEYLGTASG